MSQHILATTSTSEGSGHSKTSNPNACADINQHARYQLLKLVDKYEATNNAVSELARKSAKIFYDHCDPKNYNPRNRPTLPVEAGIGTLRLPKMVEESCNLTQRMLRPATILAFGRPLPAELESMILDYMQFEDMISDDMDPDPNSRVIICKVEFKSRKPHMKIVASVSLEHIRLQHEEEGKLRGNPSMREVPHVAQISRGDETTTGVD